VWVSPSGSILAGARVPTPCSRGRCRSTSPGEKSPGSSRRHHVRMRVYVTGASGFIGGHLVHELRAAGAEARDEWIDLLDRERLRGAIAGCDAVCHLTALYRYDAPVAEHERVNVVGTRTVVLVRGDPRARSSPVPGRSPALASLNAGTATRAGSRRSNSPKWATRVSRTPPPTGLERPRRTEHSRPLPRRAREDLQRPIARQHGRGPEGTPPDQKIARAVAPRSRFWDWRVRKGRRRCLGLPCVERDRAHTPGGMYN
jgi:hypothetical protein